MSIFYTHMYNIESQSYKNVLYAHKMEQNWNNILYTMYTSSNCINKECGMQITTYIYQLHYSIISFLISWIYSIKIEQTLQKSYRGQNCFGYMVATLTGKHSAYSLLEIIDMKYLFSKSILEISMKRGFQQYSYLIRLQKHTIACYKYSNFRWFYYKLWSMLQQLAMVIYNNCIFIPSS